MISKAKMSMSSRLTRLLRQVGSQEEPRCLEFWNNKRKIKNTACNATENVLKTHSMPH